MWDDPDSARGRIGTMHYPAPRVPLTDVEQAALRTWMAGHADTVRWPMFLPVEQQHLTFERYRLARRVLLTQWLLAHGRVRICPAVPEEVEMLIACERDAARRVQHRPPP